MNRSDALASFIHDVKQLLATDSTQEASLERIAARMRELVTDPVIRSCSLWARSHAQQGYDGEAAYELVLFGANPAGKPRLYFDVKLCENFAFFPPLEHPGPSVAPAIAVISSGLAPGCPRYRHFIGRMTSFGIILDTEAVIVR
jgi:hypothetical protein